MKAGARGPEPIPPRRREPQPVILNVTDPAALTPGCKVLVSVPRRIDAEAAKRYQDLLAERFPDVEFTIITGRVEAVYPPQAPKPGGGR